MTRSSPTRLYRLGIRKPRKAQDTRTVVVADKTVTGAVQRWNAIVPAVAVGVRSISETHFAYLHPTKGWKIVRKERVFK